VVQFVQAVRKQIKKGLALEGLNRDRNNDGSLDMAERAGNFVEGVSLRLQAFLAALAAESIVGTTLRFALLLIPWPFYIAIFQVRRAHDRSPSRPHAHPHPHTPSPSRCGRGPDALPSSGPAAHSRSPSPTPTPTLTACTSVV
jgi:hypothetical protein